MSRPLPPQEDLDQRFSRWRTEAKMIGDDIILRDLHGTGRWMVVR